MVRHAIRAGFIEMHRMTLNDRTDFERSPKPNGTPIFCPQQILENSFPPVKHPKRARLWSVVLGLFWSIVVCKGRSYDTSFKTSLYLIGKMSFSTIFFHMSRVTQNVEIL